jgi:hypothetical protein
MTDLNNPIAIEFTAGLLVVCIPAVLIGIFVPLSIPIKILIALSIPGFYVSIGWYFFGNPFKSSC